MYSRLFVILCFPDCLPGKLVKKSFPRLFYLSHKRPWHKGFLLGNNKKAFTGLVKIVGTFFYTWLLFFLFSFYQVSIHFIIGYDYYWRKDWTIGNLSQTKGPSLITSAYFWPFRTPPNHIISINTVLNVSKTGHFLDPPTYPPSSFADVI